MRKIICDKCKKNKGLFKIRVKLEKLNAYQKVNGKAYNHWKVFCKKCGVKEYNKIVEIVKK